MRRYLAWPFFVLTALNTVVVGVDKLSATPIVLWRGTDTGFGASPTEKPLPGLLLVIGIKADCYLRLRITDNKGDPVSSGKRAFHMYDAQLAPRPDEVEPAVWVEVVPKEGPPGAERTYFRWPSGKRILITCTDPQARPMRVGDWEVHLNDSKLPYDSHGRFLFRWGWFIVSVLLFVAATFYALWPAREETQDPPVHDQEVRRTIVAYLITQVDAPGNPEKTRAMRQLLRVHLLSSVTNPLTVVDLKKDGYKTRLDREKVWKQARMMYEAKYIAYKANPIIP
jgi:hypothetical protein